MDESRRPGISWKPPGDPGKGPLAGKYPERGGKIEIKGPRKLNQKKVCKGMHVAVGPPATGTNFPDKLRGMPRFQVYAGQELANPAFFHMVSHESEDIDLVAVPDDAHQRKGLRGGSGGDLLLVVEPYGLEVLLPKPAAVQGVPWKFLPQDALTEVSMIHGGSVGESGEPCELGKTPGVVEQCSGHRPLPHLPVPPQGPRDEGRVVPDPFHMRSFHFQERMERSVPPPEGIHVSPEPSGSRMLVLHRIPLPFSFGDNCTVPGESFQTHGSRIQ